MSGTAPADGAIAAYLALLLHATTPINQMTLFVAHDDFIAYGTRPALRLTPR
jgi:hypothetical protein